MAYQKTIETDRYYGRDPLIHWIYNRAISGEFPNLFKGFWGVYETWYYHFDRLKEGLSSFLSDPTLPPVEQLWKYERFGNYLYGSYVSVYFSWDSLQAVKTARNLLEDPQSNLAFIRQVNGVVQYLFTALDAISCCIYIVEDKIPRGCQLAQAEKKYLQGVMIKNVHGKIGAESSAYAKLNLLLDRDEFKYLSKYRNLLTHRPFPQFSHDSRGLPHFPEDLVQLDSTTQNGQLYLEPDVGSYLVTAFEIVVTGLEALLLELDTRYRERI